VCGAYPHGVHLPFLIYYLNYCNRLEINDDTNDGYDDRANHDHIFFYDYGDDYEGYDDYLQ
tara:strand:- start:398 stop:580 length:183 start_codon:yes stop_codon:yes gene_type:complete